MVEIDRCRMYRFSNNLVVVAEDCLRPSDNCLGDGDICVGNKDNCLNA
jgi:hypothetical protein